MLKKKTKTMTKRIGLSAAAILALVALAKPPAAMAADRDDYGRRDYQQSRDYRDGDNRYSRDYSDRDYQAPREFQKHREYYRSDWSQDRSRGHEDRDRDGDHDRNYR